MPIEEPLLGPAEIRSCLASEASVKPRLVFFQSSDAGLPTFIQLHFAEHVKCLSTFFDVKVVRGNCDYSEVCDAFEPDVALFESGVYRRERVDIQNTHSNPQVPKLGLLVADAYCVTRSRFMRDMERWGADTFFTISVSMAEYFPEIRDRLFTWANFIDPSVFRDYRMDKTVTSLETGSHASHYLYRLKLSRALRAHFDVFRQEHHGWFDAAKAQRMVHGEAYSRLLNSALFVPTCGTIAKEVVRKHFEIPGSRACLVTERTDALEAAGFVDMQNCVFADETDVVDKVLTLMRDPDLYARVVAAGYQLTHARHTMAARSEIFDWYMLNKNLAHGQKIVQTAPFAGLKVVEDASASNFFPNCLGDDRIMLIEAAKQIDQGNYIAADATYRKIDALHYVPEAKLGIARCHLLSGRPYAGLTTSLLSMEALHARHAVDLPDPVEWSYVITALICIGDVQEAIARFKQFPKLYHPELERLRVVLCALSNSEIEASSDLDRKLRTTLHVTPATYDEWIDQFTKMLEVSGQRRLAARLAVALLAKGDQRYSKKNTVKPSADFPPELKYYRKRSSLQRFIHKLQRDISKRISLS